MSELEQRVDALEARLEALEERLGGRAEGSLSWEVAAHALESLWEHLDVRGVAGFPPRIAAEVEARAEAACARRDAAGLTPDAVLALLDLKALAERLVVSATRPLMHAIDRRLAELGVQPAPAPAAQGGSPQRSERLSHLEQRLERLEADDDAESSVAGDRHFLALARRVKALESRVTRELVQSAE